MINFIDRFETGRVRSRAMDHPVAVPLTGFKPDAQSGIAQDRSVRGVILTPQDLPIYITFAGRRYVLFTTKYGNLVLNGRP
jgi:hypothetical protein